MLPGKANYFATAMSLSGVATGLLANRMKAGLSRSRVIRTIRAAVVRPTHSLRRRSLECMTRIARSRSRSAATQNVEGFMSEIRAAIDQNRADGGAGIRF